jgi:citrate lyase beta subunit
VVEAYQEARAKGLGATTLGGKMIDFGSFKRAESLLAFAGAVTDRERAARVQ